MRFFKYFISFLLLTFSVTSYSATLYYFSAKPNNVYGSPAAACAAFPSLYGSASTIRTELAGLSCRQYRVSDGGYMGASTILTKTVACPSSTKTTVSVPLNAQKYQCINQCQYALTGCVNIQFDSGGDPDGGDRTKMTCSAISTGIDCGGTPPPKPPSTDPNAPQNPDSTSTPAAPGQNTSNTNTNTATSTGTSTSTSTSTTTNNTTNNTSTTNTTTTTVNNTTTKIDLSSLESAIASLGSILAGKLDAIKEALGGDTGSENGTPDGTDLTETNQKLDDIKKNGEKTNNWLQGKNEDGTGGGVGDNPFGTDVTPERTLDAQSFKTNIFQSNAQCPADKTLSMTLFTGRTFSHTLSFAMWCDKLAIFGSLILIAAYLYGASIIVRNS